MTVFRIHGAAYDAFDTTGTSLYDGRWHTRGSRVIYTAEHVSLAALEVLVHAGGRKMPPKMLTRVELPEGFSTETAKAMGIGASQVFGDKWLKEKRTAVLRVPSVVVQGMEFNLLLNPAHEEFAKVKKGKAVGFVFDVRLVR